MGVNSLLNIGNHALLANQVAINVTGNNIANVNTEGYSRQSVRFEEFRPMWSPAGQIGMGAHAADIYRHFNRFVENSYLDRFSTQQRWAEQSMVMQSVENLFNEANRDGINTMISRFFSSWQTLTQKPDDMPSREALLTEADNLSLLMRDTYATLEKTQREMDDYIAQSVTEANELIENIAKINVQISSMDIPGRNANQLLDQRDQMTRKLAELVDVDVQDRGGGDYSIFTKGGKVLVEKGSSYSLEFRGPRVEKQTKDFMGELTFTGTDSYEYLMEFVDDKQFKVSLDGGKSWLRNDDGSLNLFEAPPAGETLRVKNLEIKFENTGLPDGTPITFTAGDKFDVVPKSGLYWDSPTRDALNITPQITNDGVDNPSRLSGGKIAAYFNVRDNNLGRYMDKMNAFANSLIWEVNKIHSQGSGLVNFESINGNYPVKDSLKALGDSASGLTFSDRLTEGNLTLHFFDKATGQTLLSGPLNFSPVSIPGEPVENFDPSKHSLSDVVDAINRSYPDPKDTSVPPRNMVTASIEGNRLVLKAAEGVELACGTDSTGLLAGLGLNTFFQGSSAADISLDSKLKNNPSHINSHSVDGQDESNPGDGDIASAIANLAKTPVRISTLWDNSTQTFNSYYAGIVGIVGSETRNAMFNEQYNGSLADALATRSSSISGVNLDEEMTSLIKFQHSYTAAAKLITTANQMMETILSLKQ